MRKIDKFVFDAVKNGEKIIETRAATEKYKKIQPGDTLVFVCGAEKIEREVENVEHFISVDDMVKEINFKKIMPFCKNVEEMKKIYYNFPGYKEKIKNFGLLVFDLKLIK